MRLSGRFHSRIAVVLAIVGLLMVAMPVHGATKFGADLSGLPFPDNAYPGQWCDHVVDGGSDTYNCTWIMAQAYHNNGATGAQAPKNGFINKIKLIGGQSTPFTLFIATYNQSTHKGTVVRKGPKITPATDPCTIDCAIQKFNINPPLQISTGQYLAVKATKLSILQCSQGSVHVSVYKPPLPLGGAATNESGHTGCYLLLQAVYQ